MVVELAFTGEIPFPEKGYPAPASAVAVYYASHDCSAIDETDWGGPLLPFPTLSNPTNGSCLVVVDGNLNWDEP